MMSFKPKLTEEELSMARDSLIEDEGIRLKPYLCPAKKLTIGVGRNLEDKGLTKFEAEFLLTNDIIECAFDLLSIFKDFQSFSKERKIALINMRFNLGHTGFRGFKNMINAINDNNWGKASVEALNSKWAKQVKGRANRIAAIILRGA